MAPTGTVSARMRVSSVVKSGPTAAYVTMSAVYSSDPDDPNYSYSQATPSASVTMSINNPAVVEHFAEGDEVDVTFSKTGSRNTGEHGKASR